MRVLIVDDDSLMRTLLVVSLGAMGVAETVEAGDGDEAWQMLQDRPFDLAIIDWHMPGKTGLELVRDVRARGSQIPILMVTAEAARAHVIEALQAGATDYLIKPFENEVLWTKLNKLYARVSRR